MKTWLVIIGIFLITYIFGSWLKPSLNDEAKLIITACDPNQNKCQLNLDNQLLTFRFTELASPLTPFGVELVAPQSLIESVSVAFEMQGMDMGYHQHPLIKQQNNWRARVTLPVCSLGRNDWIVKLMISTPTQNVIHQFHFVQNQNE